jgi:transposase
VIQGCSLREQGFGVRGTERGGVGAHRPAPACRRGRVGRPSHDNRRVLNGILWTVRSGARWIDVPERYGRWNSVYRRFRRWSQTGVFEALLETLAGALAEESLQMLDSTIVRAHAQAAGAKRGERPRRSGVRAAGSRPRSTSEPMPKDARLPLR